jgi:hypothetical protein
MRAVSFACTSCRWKTAAAGLIVTYLLVSHVHRSLDQGCSEAGQRSRLEICKRDCMSDSSSRLFSAELRALFNQEIMGESGRGQRTQDLPNLVKIGVQRSADDVERLLYVLLVGSCMAFESSL